MPRLSCPRRRALIASLLALAATAPARATAAAPEPAPPGDPAAAPADAPQGPNCINRRDIRDIRLLDRRTLRVRMNGAPDYLNRLDSDCRFREGLDVWVFRSPTGLICQGETLDIASRGIGRTGFCRLGRWEPQPRVPRAAR